MKIRFMGIGSAINTDSLGSSILIDDRILVDAPCAITSRLHSYDVPLGPLDCVLLTHLHGDHVFGLPFLLLEFNLQARERPLRIIGPGGSESLTQQLTKLAFPELDPERVLAAAKPAFTTIADGTACDLGDITLVPHRVPHGQSETYAFECHALSGESLFYAPDLEDIRKHDALLSSADAVLIDATTLDPAIPGHMSLMQVRDIAIVNPDKHFYAIHRSRYALPSEDMPPNLRFPSDGDEFVVG